MPVIDIKLGNRSPSITARNVTELVERITSAATKLTSLPEDHFIVMVTYVYCNQMANVVVIRALDKDDRSDEWFQSLAVVVADAVYEYDDGKSDVDVFTDIQDENVGYASRLKKKVEVQG